MVRTVNRSIARRPVTSFQSSGADTVACGFARTAYGATIVAFLGGLHWGLAARGNGAGAQYAWGVLPSLLAWGALLLPDRPGLYVLAASLVACYLVDRRVLPAQGLGGWMPLRALLTVIAAGSCLVGALAV